MLTGKTAVVTGGSRGIGAAIVRKLASQGANVAVVYAGSQALAEELCAQCAAEFSGKAVAYRCDVADFAAVKDLMAQIKKEFGTVDILVNNAGVTQDGLLAMMKEESFDRVLDVDLKGAFNCIRHCAGMFLRQKHGAIVNVSSVSGMIGNPGQANYSAAKAGLIGLTKAAAKSPLSWPDRSRVISVSIKPGATALQVIPLGASSLATALVRPMSPALAAE